MGDADPRLAENVEKLWSVVNLYGEFYARLFVASF